MENLRDEIWKDIEGYEGMYQVSNLGRVRSLERIDASGKTRKSRMLSAGVSKGYESVVLFKNRKGKSVTVHRLVAKAFIPNPSNKRCVNHIDHDKLNNKATNLEWCSHKENIKAAVRFGKYDKRMKRVFQVHIDTGKVVAKYKSTHEASRKTGWCRQPINMCCNGTAKSAFGYIWVYDINDINKRIKEHNNKGVNKGVFQICRDTNNVIGVYDSIEDAARQVNGQSANIWKCCVGRRITSSGYKWEYAEQ